MAESSLHRELSQRALIWLASKSTGRSIKGNVEIKVGANYTVDSLALCRCVSSFEWDLLSSGDWEKKQELIKQQNRLGIKWKWGVDEYPDFIFAFESKVSVADFNSTYKTERTFGNRMEPVAHFHFVVTPYNMLGVNMVPGFWGLLEKSRNGRGLSLKKWPEFCHKPKEWVHEVAYKLLRSQNKYRWSAIDGQDYVQTQIGF